MLELEIIHLRLIKLTENHKGHGSDSKLTGEN